MKSKLNANKELEPLKCPKNIRLRKSKTNGTKHLSTWAKELEELEKEIKAPDYKKLECLKRIYNDEEIEGILNSGVEIQRVKSSPPESQNFNKPKRNSNVPIRKSRSAPVRPTRYTNPYMEFMNKSYNDARCWYPKPECNLEAFPTIERAKILTKNIVDDFVEEFTSIAKSDEVNEKSLLSVFEMTCPYPICEAFNTTDEICGAVPETTAKYLGCQELSGSNKLIKQILRDTEASEKPIIKTAFGRSLPKELRRERFKENPGAKWAKKNAEHENLESFADVWKNITDLESTRKFCLYLLEHPNVIPPPYLVNEGMMTRKLLKKPVYLGDLEKQLETSSEMLDINTIINKVNKTMENFTRRLTQATLRSSTSLSDGIISEVNIMV